ncbi:MAG: glycosyltransferase [Flavobacteriaceae bacterium]
MMFAIGIVLFIYCLCMLWLLIGFDKVSTFNFSNTILKTPFTVIIPFRNEAKNLPLLLDSIKKLNYPKEYVEFIFVDDDSSDNSVRIIEDSFKKTDLNSVLPTIHIIKNKRVSNSPKKDAIQTAIELATHEWIITTDADCMLPKNWLNSYNIFIQQNTAVMIAGPVKYQINHTLLEKFQLAEFHTLQAATIGSFGIKKPMMCNGANLAYTKTAFYAVNGFEGNNTIASGDDVFLFEKMHQQYTNEVHFLKSVEALVTTFPAKSWKGFIEQRIRWASKATNYQLIHTKFVGVLVFLMNLVIVISSFLFLFGKLSLLVFIISFTIKILIDSFLLQKFNFFFEKEKRIKIDVVNGIVYPFLSVFIVLLTICTGYTWKGRHFKK